MTLTSKSKVEPASNEGTRWKFSSFASGSEFAKKGNVHLDPNDEHVSGKQMAQRALEAAYQRGLAEGFRAGNEHVRNESGEMSHRIDSLVGAMQSQFEMMDTEVADAVLGLAFSLARQVIRSELASRPELVAAAVRDALHSLALKATYPGIYLNPDDLNLVKSSLAEELTARGCRLVADAGISRGGCRLESDTSMVDATVESRWERALSNMGYTGSEYDNVSAAR